MIILSNKGKISNGNHFHTHTQSHIHSCHLPLRILLYNYYYLLSNRFMLYCLPHHQISWSPRVKSFLSSKDWFLVLFALMLKNNKGLLLKTQEITSQEVSLGDPMRNSFL